MNEYSFTDLPHDAPASSGNTANAMARRIAAGIAGVARVIAPFAVALVIISAAVFAGASVARLAANIGLPLPMVILTPISTVGVVVAMVSIIMLSDHPPVRAIAIITLLFWLPLLVMLVGLDVTITSPPIGYDTSGNPIYIVRVPDAVVNIARVGAGFLPGIVLLPAVALIVAWRRESDGGLLSELAHYASNSLKAILLVSTWGAGVYFGVTRGMPPEIAFFASALLELSFLLALTRVLHEASPRWLHTLAMVGFGVAIGIVAIETMGEATGIKTLPGLDRVGEALYLMAPAAGLAYVVLSSVRWGAPSDHGIADAIADRIYGIRSGLGRIALALRGVHEQPQLPPSPSSVPAELFSADDADDTSAQMESSDQNEEQHEGPPPPKRRRRSR